MIFDLIKSPVIFWVKGCSQRLSIAAGGGFYNVPPATAAWFCFKS